MLEVLAPVQLLEGSEPARQLQRLFLETPIDSQIEHLGFTELRLEALEGQLERLLE